MSCVVEYVGTAYVGFQRQPGAMSVQGALESAVKAVTGETVTVSASGRTDAGAHALAQIVSFTTASAMPSQDVCHALNAHLPNDIAVIYARDVAPSFHPRFDADRRTYRYLIWNRPIRSPFWRERAAHIRKALDVAVMDQAAGTLIGRLDVRAFVPSRLDGEKVRQVHAARCWREDDLVLIELEASGFMRQMVRAIAGTLIRVGQGSLSLDGFASVVAAGERHAAGETAPACGLYLVRVNYPHDQRALITLARPEE